MSVAIGFVYAAISAVFNGSYIAPFKAKSIVELHLHPIVFQLYVTIGLFLSCFLAIPFFPYNHLIADTNEAGTTFEFSPLAVVGGAMFVVALVASFSAVELIGLAVAQGVWSGVALLVSFVWGVVGFGQKPVDWVMTGGGIAVLALGVVCVATCNQIADRYFPDNSLLGDTTHTGNSSLGTSGDVLRSSFGIDDGSDLRCGGLPRVFSAVVPPAMVRERSLERGSQGGELERWKRISGLSENSIHKIQWFSGIMWALLVGLAGGSILAPLHYVPCSQLGLVFLPSFGIGAMATSPLMVLLHRIWNGCLPNFQFRDTFLIGALSGVLWNISNIFALLAIPIVGYAIAYPMMQCAILVAGVWGVVVFKEISGNAVRVFFMSSLVVIIGAVFLSLGFYL